MRRNKEGVSATQPGHTIDIDTAKANAIAKRKSQEHDARMQSKESSPAAKTKSIYEVESERAHAAAKLQAQRAYEQAQKDAMRREKEGTSAATTDKQQETKKYPWSPL
jgi:hypothetical protein